ncbi:hypothetical protein GCM10027280_19510 [Micromonospora polyrhachis]
MWLDGANPELALRIRALVDAEDRYADLAAALAVELGAVLVPHPALDTATRRHVLACRRRLHRSQPIDPAGFTRLVSAAQAAGEPDLATRLTVLAMTAERTTAERTTVDVAVDEELARLLPAPWTMLTESPVGRHALADGDITAGDDIAARVRVGEAWQGKRLRQRSEYLWRMISRGAAKTTPRGWLGHVSLIPATEDGTYPVTLGPEVAARWTENVHALQAEPPAGRSRVALAPLHQLVDGQLRVWVVRPDDPTELHPVTLRMTPHLTRVHAALRHGARSIDEVIAALVTDPDDARQRTTWHGFLSHLVKLGVCQFTGTPRVRRTGWRDVGQQVTATAEPDAPGFVDVYRRATADWPAATGALVQAALGPVQRLNALMSLDEEKPSIVPDHIGPDRRPVLDLLGELLADESHSKHEWRPAVWPTTDRPDSGYARLLRLIADTSTGQQVVDLDDDLLDRLGAPPAEYGWPVDCLVRPLADGGVVLDAIASAGMLDARFAAELTALHPASSHVDAYRRFLRELDAQTGVTSVELLTPALAERAANAVRRPLYPTAWTGDADLEPYCDVDVGSATHIPLEALTARRVDDRIVIEADGRRVRIMYHATRQPPTPWSLLLSILQGGPTLVATRFRRLRHSLAALPDQAYLPRVTVRGSTIVSPAQWRLRPARLWDPADSPLAKAKHLARLRDRLGLPRWIMLCARPGGRPVPCDLDSLRAPSVFEAVSDAAVTETTDAAVTEATDPDEAQLIVEEMVPAPDELPVRDLVDGRPEPVAAELLLRLPQHTDPASLAVATAAALAGTPVGWPGPADHRNGAELPDQGLPTRAIALGPPDDLPANGASRALEPTPRGR